MFGISEEAKNIRRERELSLTHDLTDRSSYARDFREAIKIDVFTIVKNRTLQSFLKLYYVLDKKQGFNVYRRDWLEVGKL